MNELDFVLSNPCLEKKIHSRRKKLQQLFKVGRISGKSYFGWVFVMDFRILYQKLSQDIFSSKNKKFFDLFSETTYWIIIIFGTHELHTYLHSPKSAILKFLICECDFQTFLFEFDDSWVQKLCFSEEARLSDLRVFVTDSSSPGTNLYPRSD